MNRERFKLRMRKIGVFFKNLLFPPRCAACREFMQKDIFDLCENPFCEKCRTKWEFEKLSACPDCGLEMTICNCSAPLLRKSSVEEFVKLVNYSSKSKSVGKNAILHIKRNKSTRVFNFFAEQLSYSARLKNNAYDKSSVLVAYVPRGESSRIKYGFDQSRELALRLAKKLDVRCCALFARNRKSKAEQKKLSLNERRENAKNMYAVNKSKLEFLDGVKCVFIVDDVITSGASLYGCISALKEHYTGKIICVSIARTGKKK